MVDNKILRLFAVLIVSALLISALIQRDLVRDKITRKRAEDGILVFLKEHLRDLKEVGFSSLERRDESSVLIFKVSITYQDGYAIALDAYYDSERNKLNTEALGNDLTLFYHYETYKGQTVEPVTIIRSNGSREVK